MTTLNEQLPERVVATFKTLLHDETRVLITEREYHELARLVREALSIELSKAADMVDDVAKQLRSMTEHQDLDL